MLTDGIYDIDNLWKLFIIYDQMGNIAEAKYYLKRLNKLMEYVPLNLDYFVILRKYSIIDLESYHKARLYKPFSLKCYNIGAQLINDSYNKNISVIDFDIIWTIFRNLLGLPVGFEFKLLYESNIYRYLLLLQALQKFKN